MIIKEPADWKFNLRKIASDDSHSFVVSNKVMLIIPFLYRNIKTYIEQHSIVFIVS